MRACKINIGHNRDHVGKQPLSDQFVTDVIEAESEVWTVWPSTPRHYNTSYEGVPTERVTVVGLCSTDEQALKNFIEELCGHFEQECISTLWGPVWRPPFKGEFIGPEADKLQAENPWDPKWFINTDGHPLTK